MLWHIAWFEIRFWLRSWMLWIFLFVVGLLIFGAISSDEVMAELNLSNIYRNAPFAIASFYAAMGVFTSADDRRICQFCGSPRLQLQHPPDDVLDARAAPRLPAWALSWGHPGLGDTHAGRLSRHSAGQVHALGGSRNAGRR